MDKNFYLLLIIISCFLFQHFNCQSNCSNCQIEQKECINCGDNNNNCHWFKIDSNKEECLPCNDKDGEESNYYSKKTTIDGVNYCHKIGKTGISKGKLIVGTNQIVNDCISLGYYQLGDFCYDACPGNSEDVSNNKICKCKDFYYKTLGDNLETINCITECSEFPFFDGTTKECLKKCPNGKPFLGKSSTTNTLECRSSCPNKKYTKTLLTGETITYCLDSCPDEAKYYYDDNICVNKCNKNSNDFISLNNKCINLSNIKNVDCGNEYYITIDPEAQNYLCKSGKECPEQYPYKFIKNNKIYCLRKCEDTYINFFNNINTFTNIQKKQCLEKNNQNDEKYYIIEEEKRYIEDCSTDITGPFHDGKKCVITCGEKYLVEDTNECVNECDITNYFIDEKTKMCVKVCPSNFGRGFYYETSKKCTPCAIEGEEEDLVGFHKENDNICYPECPNGFKHIYKNNICFEGECINTDYKFSSPEFPKTCFYNCPDIIKKNDDDDDIKYLIEIDYTCYDVLPSSYSNYYYYEIKIDYHNNNIKKYLSPEKARKECFKRDLKYIKDSQCVQACLNDDYKVLPSKNEFGFCFRNKNECINKEYIFYNNDKKECSKKCNYYTIEDNTGDYENDEGKCIANCPEDYKFDGNICKSDCFYKK